MHFFLFLFLFLSGVVVGKSPNDFLIKDLPLISDNPVFDAYQEQYAGFLSINGSLDSGLFFWFIPKPGFENDTSIPVTLWLNGGPGFSSIFGLFVENGPFRIDGRAGGYNITLNEYAWTNVSHMLYIDNPIGVGYSYAANRSVLGHNEHTIAYDLYQGLLDFFSIFPTYKSNPFVISGESYAGKYIPTLSTFILNQENNEINLKKVLMGDPWVNPMEQNFGYVEYYYTLGLVDEKQRDFAMNLTLKTQEAIEEGAWLKANHIGNQLVNFLSAASGNIDIDDINDSKDPTQSGAKALSKYLNAPDVKEALHVGNATYQEQNNAVFLALNADEQKSTLDLLPALMKAYDFMIYVGSVDANCNIRGIYDMLNQLEWIPPYSHRGYYHAKRQVWNEGGKSDGGLVYGYVKQYLNFTLTSVLRSGHEVPFFVPKRSLAMFDNFVNELSWGYFPFNSTTS